MQHNPLFPRIVEEYKSHLRTHCERPLSFSAFCRGYNIRYSSITQWMRRHRLSVEILRYEVFLEGYPVNSLVNSVETKQKERIQGDHLKGVSITFPDGVIVAIRQSSASALSNFIDSYNKIIDLNYVQPE